MIENLERVQNVDSIFEDVKFATNSAIRLKILATLYEKPQNMKELTETTSLSYSSISSNMHVLELRDFIYRQHNKYFLTNSARLRIENIMEFNRVVMLINEFFNILDHHVVGMIPTESVAELYLLGNANLMESSGVDAYRTYNFIDRCLSMASDVKCVLPFYYEPFFNSLEDLVSKDRDVELFVPFDVFEIIEDETKIKNVTYFDEDNVFLLIVTNQVMILGLFMENGFFDKNRLIASKNPDSLLWANNLFENFKKRNDK
jgi:predicted transcriptional regulator